MTASDSIDARSMSLTSEQQAAVDANDPALVIRAPAGTGKTEVLVQRAARFVCDPANGYKRVLVVTYTTRAAEEFTSRLKGLLGSAMGRITAETVHGFAQSLLAFHGSHVGLPLDFQVIVKDEDRAELLALFEPSWEPDAELSLFRELDLARAKGSAHSHLGMWRKALAHSGAVDFNEMITKATEVLQIDAIAQMIRNVYGLVLVDEAQNLTRQQYEFIVALVGQHPESHSPQVPTTLLGDPNQLVTGFAGGDSGNMKDFRSTFGATELTLSKNFRSSRRLSRLEQVVSQELGRNGRHRGVGAEEDATGILELCQFDSERAEGEYIAKWVDGLLTDGLPLEAVMPQESRRILPEEIAVLARHAATLAPVSEALASNGQDVARAHSEADYMSSKEGKLALLLVQSRSDRHRDTARGELCRDFGIDLTVESVVDPAACLATPDSSRGAEVSLVELLAKFRSFESPLEFIEALDECRLEESEGCVTLANWLADRDLLRVGWEEFANVTPKRERSWTRFSLHIDRMAQKRDLGTGVRVLTVHKAQGREFKAVAIVGMNDGQFPDFRATSPDSMRDELQTFYVAATRASRMLLLTRAESRPTRYGPRPTEPSPYLKLVKEARRDPQPGPEPDFSASV